MPSPLKKSFAAEVLIQRQKRRMKHRLWIYLLVVIAVIVGIFAVYSRYIAPPEKSEITSIAVLPFRDMSSDKTQGHLCEGIAEAIIDALASLIRAVLPSGTDEPLGLFLVCGLLRSPR